MDAEVLVIGAGLAGLSCTLELQSRGIDARILERSDRVGGRVRTDRVDGFLLDRGFQVRLTAYPNTSELLDFEALDLKTFTSGALIRRGGRFHRLTDPLRDPAGILATLRSPIGSISDKFKMLTMRQTLTGMPYEDLWSRPELTTIEALRDRWQFSDNMIDGFFRPFLGGVTLDASLQTSSRFLEFVMRMFAEGDAAVPARGMQAIPDQLAGRLHEGTIQFGTEVRGLDGDGLVGLTSGQSLRCEKVVVATEGPAAWQLTGRKEPGDHVGVTSLYFSSENAPIREPILVLSAEGGFVNNLAVMSQVSADYAPAGAELVSVTVLGRKNISKEEIERSVRSELTGWFGSDVASWRLLDLQHIEYALPLQSPPSLDPAGRDVQLGPRLFVCGDHRDTASIEGAITSGLRTADRVMSN